MESVDECLPPTEKETSDRSRSSGLLAQGDKDKGVSMVATGDRVQHCDRYTEDRGRMHGHRLNQTKENLKSSISHQDGESVSMK